MPTLRWRPLHLLALSTMAIGQPLLSLLGDNPTFFTAHDSSPTTIVTFAILVLVAPALVASAIVLGGHAVSPTLGARLHLGFVAVFLFVFVLQIVDLLPGPAVLAVVAAAAATGGLHVLYTTSEPVRTVVSLVAVLPLAVVGLFVFSSPTNALIFPGDVTAVSLEDVLDDETLRSAAGASGPSVADLVNDRFPPIHLLVLDELPWASLLDDAGGIDDDRYPNFARLAAMSHVFSDATTSALTTERAVPSMLASTLRIEAAPVYSLYPENVFTLLGGIYDISATDPLVDLCPPSICNGAPPAELLTLLDPGSSPTTTTTTAPEPESDEGGASFGLLVEDAAIVFGHLATPDGLDIGLPSIGASWGRFGRGVGDATAGPASTMPDDPPTGTDLEISVGVTAEDGTTVDPAELEAERTAYLDALVTDDRRVAQYRDAVTDVTFSDTPRFDYLHVLLPHVPWRHHAGGEVYGDIGLAGYFEMWRDDLDLARFAQQRHLLQLGFTDLLLGEYLDRLETEGILDRSTVIVTADHGVSFLPGERARGPGERNIAGTAAVPLLYKLPGQTTGEVHDVRASTLDIVPTLAGQLGIDSPWEFDGYDLLNDTVPPDRTRVLDATVWSITIPDDLGVLVDDVAHGIHDGFGSGTDGSLYALAGRAELIGAPAADLVAAPSPNCWREEDPNQARDTSGVGFVFGRVRTPAGPAIDFAVVVDGLVAGTARTLDDETPHRVYALGDPSFWSNTADPIVELHELTDAGLAPMARC